MNGPQSPIEPVSDLPAEIDLVDAIGAFAAVYLREHGATDSNAELLSDAIWGALGWVEGEQRFAMLAEVLERAFNRLRLLGYRCEQDWQCCMTCGWDMIPEADADLAVWYHRQDRDKGIRRGKLLLVWAGDPAVIRRELEIEGLQVEHDGSASTRILVSLPSSPPIPNKDAANSKTSNCSYDKRRYGLPRRRT